MPKYILYSCIDSCVKFISVNTDIEILKEKIVNYSKTWICDRIGNNNYIDTINSEKNIEDIPGYILKYSDLMPEMTKYYIIPSNITNIIQLNLFLNEKKKIKGWIYNSQHKDVKFLGYFAICELPMESPKGKFIVKPMIK